jgi:hypothetical protein
MRLASHKLGIKTKFIRRGGVLGGGEA